MASHSFLPGRVVAHGRLVHIVDIPYRRRPFDFLVVPKADKSWKAQGKPTALATVWTGLALSSAPETSATLTGSTGPLTALTPNGAATLLVDADQRAATAIGAAYSTIADRS